MRNKLIVFILLILFVFIFLYFFRALNTYKKPVQKVSGKLSPSATRVISPVVKNTIADLKTSQNLRGNIRYLTSSYDLNEKTNAYENRTHVVTYNLEKNTETGRVTRNWIFTSLSPSGKYLTGSTELDTDKTTSCSLHILNLDSDREMSEVYEQSCGGPFAPVVTSWSDRERYVNMSTASHKIIDLQQMKIVANYPAEGVSRGGNMSADNLYLAYEILNNFFSFEGKYSSFGIIKIDGNKSGSKKVFKMNRQNSNDFRCWRGHEAIFVRRYYDNSKIKSPDLSTEPIDLSIYSYDLDKDKLSQLCRGMACEGKVEGMCEKTADSQTSSFSPEQTITTRLSNSYDLTISESVLNSARDLLLFSAKKTSLTGSSDTDHYEPSVFVSDLKNDILYKLSYGRDVRFLVDNKEQTATNSAVFRDCQKIGEYVSRNYKISFMCPEGWSMMQNPGSEFNFVKTGDETPAKSGFSLVVDDGATGTTLAVWCNLHFAEQPLENFLGYLCPSDRKVMADTVKINGHVWEKIQNDQIGVPPYGYVNYNSYYDGLLITIPNYSADKTVVDRFVSSIKFLGN